MIEFSKNVQCSFGRIMMDNIRDVKVIVGACIYVVTREGMSL